MEKSLAECFDCVLCAAALFLLPDPLPVLRGWRRVLKPGGTVAFASYGNRSLQPLARLLETCLERYTLPGYSILWPLLTLEQHHDLLRNAGFSVMDVRSEHYGYHLTIPEEWWDIVEQSGLRGRLAQLSTAAMAQFKREHLAAVAALTTPCGIELEVVTIFAFGQKS